MVSNTEMAKIEQILMEFVSIFDTDNENGEWENQAEKMKEMYEIENC